MAANEYYNPSPPRHYGQHDYDLTPSSDFSRPLPQRPYDPSPSGLEVNHQPTAYESQSYSKYSQPFQSQQSLDTDTSYSKTGPAHLQDPDPYADNIPLRQTQSPDTRLPPLPIDPDGPKTSRGRNRRGGFFSGKITWVCYVLTVVQIAVFIGEIVKNAVLTKSPIEIHPQFNPMIGPSSYVMINMGARFVPCMHKMAGITDSSITWACPNTTSSNSDDASNHCSLAELCGFSKGSMEPEPDQWYRFIIPMFLHAGIIHIGFNMVLQLTIGRDMERTIGSIRFALVYFSSGIFGFVLGGNYAATGIASTGCSGCLFGIVALTLLDLLYSWQSRVSPLKDLMFIGIDIVISLVLGLLPGLDNFSHIGGLLMGLVLGVCILHSPESLRRRVGEVIPYGPYVPVTHGRDSIKAVKGFISSPLSFFKGRKPLWWAWWLIRAAALVGVLVAFIVLLKNFYKWRETCSWCKYLSCLVLLPHLLDPNSDAD
ncbi:MAG: hypothetical protein M1819_006985 [Sarea resinae]|nr:MAG: hypothetical protein M1819_006985 [Sarea resinae]